MMDLGGRIRLVVEKRITFTVPDKRNTVSLRKYHEKIILFRHEGNIREDSHTKRNIVTSKRTETSHGNWEDDNRVCDLGIRMHQNWIGIDNELTESYRIAFGRMSAQSPLCKGWDPHINICLAIAIIWLSAKSRPPPEAFFGLLALENVMSQPLTMMLPRRRRKTSEYRIKLKTADINIYQESIKVTSELQSNFKTSDLLTNI